MKTCSIFIKQSILIAVWILVAINCSNNDRLILLGLLAIIAMNMALLFYNIKVNLDKEALCTKKQMEAVEALTKQIDVLNGEVRALKESVLAEQKKKEEEQKKKDEEQK